MKTFDMQASADTNIVKKETMYFLTAKGASRCSLPIGTPLARAKRTAYTYLVGKSTESPFVVHGDIGGCGYMLQFGDWSLSDPLSREEMGPWVITRNVEVGVDKLPADKEILVGWKKEGVFRSLTVVVNSMHYYHIADDLSQRSETAIKQFLKENPLYNVPYDTLYVNYGDAQFEILV